MNLRHIAERCIYQLTHGKRAMLMPVSLYPDRREEMVQIVEAALKEAQQREDR